MTISNTASNYSVAFGTSSDAVAVPVISRVDPTIYNVQYPIGKRWINELANNEWALTSFSTIGGTYTANWQISASPSLLLSSLSGDTGTAFPVAGNIKLAGTAAQIATAASGSTVTFSLIGPYTPATYTAHGVLIGEGATSIVATTPGTDGQVLTGNTGADPTFDAIGTKSGLTAHGVLIAEGAGAFAATATGTSGQFLTSGGASADPTWSTATPQLIVTPVAGATQAMTSNNSYIANDSSLTTFTLPTTSAVGDILQVVGSSLNSGGWKITYTTNQIIWGPGGHSTLTSGNAATGSAAAQVATLVCTVANTIWVITSNSGTITLT